MTAPDNIDPTAWLHEHLALADLLRSMVKTFADAMMSADADQRCLASYGQCSTERVNSRNGYRTRDWDTRTGTVVDRTPDLRPGPVWVDLTGAGLHLVPGYRLVIRPVDQAPVREM